MSYQTMQRRFEQKTFRILKQKAELPSDNVIEVVYDHRQDTVLVHKRDSEAVTVGTVLNLQLSKCNVIVTGLPTHGETAMSYPVQKFHLFGELYRSGVGTTDNFGRPSSELQLLANNVPLISRGGQKFFTDPELAIQQGDRLHIRNSIYHVQDIRGFTGQLAELVTVKQL